MRADRSDPPRIDDGDPPALREFVHGTLARGPSAAAAERMSKRLAASVASPTPADKKATRIGQIAPYHKLILVAFVVAGAALVARQQSRAWPPTADGTTPPISSEQAAPSPEPTPLDPKPSAGVATVMIEDLPSAAQAATAHAPDRAAGAGARPQVAELDFVKRAQAAIASNPEEALSITREQARAYPSGEFVQEREVIAIEALSRLGRRDEALQRAHLLVKRFPRTPYATRLEVALQRPLSSISNTQDPPPPDDGRPRGSAPNP